MFNIRKIGVISATYVIKYDRVWFGKFIEINPVIQPK